MRVKLARNEMKYKGPGEVFLTASSSRPGLFHVTVDFRTSHADDAPKYEHICSCEGFMNNGKCWHIERRKELRHAELVAWNARRYGGNRS